MSLSICFLLFWCHRVKASIFEGKYQLRWVLREKLSFQYEVDVSLGKVSSQTIMEEENEWLPRSCMEESLHDVSCAFITEISPGRGYEQNAKENLILRRGIFFGGRMFAALALSSVKSDK